MGTEVTLERYAEIRAEMEAGVPRDQALARAGLTVEAWTAAQRQWLEGMSTEIARGRFELTHRYAAAFLARQRAGPAEEEAVTVPASPSPIPRTVAVPVPAAAPPASPARPEPVAAPPLPPPRAPAAKPTFLVAAESPAPPPAAPAARPPAAPPPAGRPPVMKVNPLLMSTMMADTGPAAASPLRAALPFQVGPGGAAPRPAAAVPAAKGDPKAPPPVTIKETARPTTQPVPTGPASLSTTMAGQVAPKSAVLPFQSAPSPSAARPAAPAAPPAPSASPLTLEQYAALCVEVALDPGRSAETLQRYGLSGDQARDVDAYWKGRVATDPGVRAAFDLAYASYRAWRVAAQGKPRAT